jgi:hypothetical protein
VAGAARFRTQKVLISPSEKESIAAEGERQEGAGRMPTPQRARRPRYVPAAPDVPARYKWGRRPGWGHDPPRTLAFITTPLSPPQQGGEFALAPPWAWGNRPGLLELRPAARKYCDVV